MPEHKYKVFVNARFDVIWEKLLEKIEHPEKYMPDVRQFEILEKTPEHAVRLIKFVDNKWEDLKEFIAIDKKSGIIVYRLVDNPQAEGETVNICRSTNQVYQSELEYQINWTLKHKNGHDLGDDKFIADESLKFAVNEMKRVSEEAEAKYR